MYKLIQYEILFVLIFAYIVIIKTSASDSNLIDVDDKNTADDDGDAFTIIKNKLDLSKKTLSAETQENAAFEVIKRLFPSPEIHQKFKVFINPHMNPVSFQVRPYDR